MIGGIAGQGGFDSKGKTLGVAQASTSGTTYVNVLNISGSGYLMALSQVGTSTGAVKIVIDGITVFDGSMLNSSYPSNLALITRFETSLLVQVKGNGTTGQSCTGSYLLD